MENKISRRTILLRCLQLPIGGGVLVELAACGNGSASVCADPNAMTSAEESMRRTLQYTENSSDPNKVCAGCEFFDVGPGAGMCGRCEMFDGKPANPGGHCDSWSDDSKGAASSAT